MALSVSERKRLSRERQKVRAAERKADPSIIELDYIQQGFGQFWERQSGIFHETLDQAGIQMDGDFDKEVQIFRTESSYGEGLNALQRAVLVYHSLIDATRDLAHWINAYKLEQLDHAIAKQSARCKQADLNTLKVEVDRLERLKDIRAALSKPTRQSFPTIETGKEHSATARLMGDIFARNESRKG